jgi:hypothetical protein
MMAVPDDSPETKPEVEPTVATPVDPELQMPPLVASLNIVSYPAQTEGIPDMSAGNALTVIVVVAAQPDPVI